MHSEAAAQVLNYWQAAADPKETLIRRLLAWNFAVTLGVFCIAGCSEWPPNSEHLRDQFLENRQAYSALRQKMLSSEFVRVRTYLNVDDDTVLFEWLEYSEEFDDYHTDASIAQDPEWRALLMDARVFDVAREDDDLSLRPIPSRFSLLANLIGRQSEDKQTMEIDYVHSTTNRPQLRACRSDFASLRCGACVVDLEQDWFILYRWYPSEYSTDALVNRAINEDMSQDELDLFIEEHVDPCWS